MISNMTEYKFVTLDEGLSDEVITEKLNEFAKNGWAVMFVVDRRTFLFSRNKMIEKMLERSFTGLFGNLSAESTEC